MTAFKKFDPQAFLERERVAPTLATLATLAAPPPKNEIRRAASKIVSGGILEQFRLKTLNHKEMTMLSSTTWINYAKIKIGPHPC
jgi:hypothetical protein